jgi:hypothetical protein
MAGAFDFKDVLIIPRMTPLQPMDYNKPQYKVIRPHYSLPV